MRGAFLTSALAAVETLTFRQAVWLVWPQSWIANCVPVPVFQPDKQSVSGFTERARQIMEAAESATARGEGGSGMTILIGQDDGIQMFAASDWPLDSLAWHHGAKAVYRVSERQGSVRVE